jgi:hypothetical protein
MLICIDGSGPRSDAAYAANMEMSFVRTIYLESRLTALDDSRSAALPSASVWPSLGRGPYKLYRRGPDAVGANLVLPEQLASLVRQLWNNGDRTVFMAGFSRGGAIVINTASILKELKTQDGTKIEIEALFLFDAVDRLLYLKAQRIPSNVRHCYHAIRDKKAGSRESFGNCGRTRESHDTHLEELSDFHTTHGGIGGTGFGESSVAAEKGDPFQWDRPKVAWSSPEERLAHGFIVEGFDGPTKVTLAQQEAGRLRVQRWMWGFLRKHGVVGARRAAEFHYA